MVPYRSKDNNALRDHPNAARIETQNRAKQMNKREALEQERRVAEFKRLDNMRDQLQGVLRQIDEKPTAPPGVKPEFIDSPFTGNTRESRRVDTLRIFFTATKGGERATEAFLHLEQADISGYNLALWIKGEIAKQIKRIDEAIEKL